MVETEIYDVVVVGSGSAGITAALRGEWIAGQGEQVAFCVECTRIG